MKAQQCLLKFIESDDKINDKRTKSYATVLFLDTILLLISNTRSKLVDTYHWLASLLAPSLSMFALPAITVASFSTKPSESLLANPQEETVS